MIGFIGTSATITINYNSSQSTTLKTRSIPYWTTNVFSSTVTDLVLIYKSVTSSTAIALNDDCLKTELRLTRSQVKVKVTLRLTVSQSVSLGIEPHLGPMTRSLLLCDSYGLVLVGRSL
jgi:hypothetical protein